MDELNEELAELALEVIDEYGAEIAHTQVIEGDYNPATSSNDVTEVNGTFKALIEDLGGPNFNGTLVLNGDKKLTAAAASFEFAPATADLVTWAEGTFAVVGSPKITRFGATPVIYEVHVRK